MNLSAGSARDVPHAPTREHVRVAQQRDELRITSCAACAPVGVGAGRRGGIGAALSLGIRRYTRLAVRLSAEERAAIEAAAARAGKPVTQWARESLLAAALR